MVVLRLPVQLRKGDGLAVPQDLPAGRVVVQELELCVRGRAPVRKFAHQERAAHVDDRLGQVDGREDAGVVQPAGLRGGALVEPDARQGADRNARALGRAAHGAHARVQDSAAAQHAEDHVSRLRRLQHRAGDGLVDLVIVLRLLVERVQRGEGDAPLAQHVRRGRARGAQKDLAAARERLQRAEGEVPARHSQPHYGYHAFFPPNLSIQRRS